MFMTLLLFCLFLPQFLLLAQSSETPVWPKPLSVVSGTQAIPLSQDFQFLSQEPSASQQLQTIRRAFERYYETIFFNHHAVHLASRIPASQQGLGEQVLESLRVRVSSTNESLYLGVDESYELQIPDPESPRSGLLSAQTVYGALRGLETFSQLCVFNFTTKTMEVLYTPLQVSDMPKFPYRGLLIDTSRHYEPLKIVREVIDSMAYAKLNVLHWHIVDEQSFPVEIPSYPRLWDGAYTQYERYTLEDVKDLVEYARLRGVNIMPEMDVPGHARSWGVGYPELWPTENCTEPLDVSKESTFELIEGIISSFAEVFPFQLMHLGGDEVNTDCWENTMHIRKWLKHHNYTGQDAYQYFVLRAQSLAIKHGYTPVNWEEPFNNFGSKLDKSTIVHNWIGPGLAPKVVKAGFRCIVSDQDVWYLDHLDVPWQSFYKNDPLANISKPEEQQLVIGGEVCMWGETVDPSDIMQTIWPRAAAAAERLWSPSRSKLSAAGKRLKYFRCLLHQRGVAAAPVEVLGREPPPFPGSCYDQ